MYCTEYFRNIRHTIHGRRVVNVRHSSLCMHREFLHTFLSQENDQYYATLQYDLTNTILTTAKL